jgi:hypothetical protein
MSLAANAIFILLICWKKNGSLGINFVSHDISPWTKNDIKYDSDIRSSRLESSICLKAFLLAKRRFPTNGTRLAGFMCIPNLSFQYFEMPKSIKTIVELSGLFLLTAPRRILSGFKSKCKYPHECRSLSRSSNYNPIYIAVLMLKRLYFDFLSIIFILEP